MAAHFRQAEMELTMTNYKHLSLVDRAAVESSLDQGRSLTAIAHTLSRATATISREVNRHAVSSNKVAFGRVPNRCVHRLTCKTEFLCEDKPNCRKTKCSLCRQCNDVCDRFLEEACTRLSAPPYVCNGCHDEIRCVLRKRYYRHMQAHKECKTTLSQTRAGVNITEEELLDLDVLVSPLILQGQSIHHIAAHHSNELNICEKTLYRYVGGSLLSARNIDMPRVCRLKPRSSKPISHKVDPACRIGRSYEDYLEFVAEHPHLPVVQMDSVIGKVGGKVLLTLFLTNCDLLLAFIRERNTAQSVIDVFRSLRETLGADVFSRMFPVILTDNGSEFSNPAALEGLREGQPITRIFYCNPSAPYQKPAVENIHTLLRRILPKGMSFDHLTQEDIDLLLSHVNSYTREKLNDKSPISAFSFLYGCGVLDKLGIVSVPPDDIRLRPDLLRK